MILIIDNYDSFTYNLVQRIGEIDIRIGRRVKVYRNDKITIEQAEDLRPEKIIISPGPCTPLEAGISNDIIRHFAPKGVPILGVCLGHQCIGYAFGGKIIRAERVMHGKTSLIEHDGEGVFKGLENPFEATRYHSLMIEEKSLPASLKITARTTDRGELMGVRHKEYPVEGVQFHPESFLTNAGYKLLENFIRM